MRLTSKRVQEIFEYKDGLLIRRSTQKTCGWEVTNGYLRLSIDNKIYAVHRVIWLYSTGQFPEFEIDHINHIKTDNRIENLREATRFENCRNRQIATNNRSGVTGVCWKSSANRWVAYINADAKRKTLGTFKNMNEAIAARKAAEIQYYREFAA